MTANHSAIGRERAGETADEIRLLSPPSSPRAGARFWLEASADAQTRLKAADTETLSPGKVDGAARVPDEETRAEAFGEEITSAKTVEKVEQLKPIDEEIDALLKGYENWEKAGKGKKE